LELRKLKACRPWTLDSGILAGMTAVRSLIGLHAIALAGEGWGEGLFDVALSPQSSICHRRHDRVRFVFRLRTP
jgi:hypothetical protein